MNEDLVGRKYTDFWRPHQVEWEVTGIADAPGYVNLTRTQLRSGITEETCLPASLVRLRLRERPAPDDPVTA